MKMFFRLDYVENLHDISVDSDPDFWHLLQYGILLGLKEAGRINEIQLQQAEDNLNHLKHTDHENTC